MLVMGSDGSAARLVEPQPLAGQYRAIMPSVARDAEPPPPPPPVPPPVPGGPSSDQLIASALSAGKIDSETALAYRVFAAFGDQRLPAAYRGDDSREFEASDIVAELQVRLPTLSASSQAALRPFLLPAFAPGSWYELRSGAQVSAAAAATVWARNTTSPRVVIWWDTANPNDALIAEAIRLDIDNTIWTELTALMVEPLPDGGLPTQGIDQRPDIVIFSGRSYVSGLKDSCGNEPAAMHIDRGVSKLILAHEFMHMIQFRYKFKGCRWPEYAWLGEATATWAQHYVYPTDNGEHYIAAWMHDSPELKLEEKNDSHEYGAYLYFLNLTLDHNRTLAVPAAYEAAATNDSLSAINQAISGLGGLLKHWHEFALEYMNRDPYDSFKEKDSLGSKVKLKSDVQASPSAAGARTYTLAGDVGHLAAFHHRFTFEDASTKSVVIENPITGAAAERGKIQAVWRTKGSSSWSKPEDLTPKRLRTFCFERPDEDLAELFIVISNAEFKDRAHFLSAGDPKLTVRSSGCTGWAGTIKQTASASAPGSSYTLSMMATVDFQEHPQRTIPGVPPSEFVVLNGTVAWRFDSKIGMCSVTKGGTFHVQWPMVAGTGGGNLYFKSDAEGLYYEAHGDSWVEETADVVCPGEADYPTLVTVPGWWEMDLDKRYRLTPDGRMKGQHTADLAGGSSTWEWDLGPE